LDFYGKAEVVSRRRPGKFNWGDLK